MGGGGVRGAYFLVPAFLSSPVVVFFYFPRHVKEGTLCWGRDLEVTLYF